MTRQQEGEGRSPGKKSRQKIINADGNREAPRREIELRSTNSLFKKMQYFETLRKAGMVAETDSCVIAITAGKFALQAAGFRLPYAVTAVYPFGAEHNIVDPKGLAIVDRQYEFSPDILVISAC